ncbi:hypothetical protein [Pseudomonas sp. E102]|uniref:hypothetical protein n=1 Tax=Pseudomonas sp. E102 TaxID=181579 RepID=UPI0040454752
MKEKIMTAWIFGSLYWSSQTTTEIVFDREPSNLGRVIGFLSMPERVSKHLLKGINITLSNYTLRDIVMTRNKRPRPLQIRKHGQDCTASERSKT